MTANLSLEQTPPALSQEMTLPHNITIEQALLSALMNVSDSYDKVASVVSVDDFYGERHKHIFRCIEHLALANQPYDSLTVYDSLMRQDLLSAVGGEQYLMQIEQSTGTAFNLENYAERVKELSVYRKLIGVSNKILELAYRPKTQPLREILDIAESEIFAINDAINQRSGKQGVKEGQVVVKSVVDMLQQLQGRAGNMLLGLDTSFAELNNKTQGLQKGDLIILAARPSMGKTTLAINLAQSVLQIAQLPVVIFSMEMSAESIVMRFLSAWGGIPQGNLRSGQMTPDEWARFGNGAEALSRSKLYIDDRNNLPPSEVRSVCRKIAKAHPTGLGLVVVDYLQLMKVPGMENNRVGEISEISRNLKALARELDCPVIALSQLSRKVEERPNKRPIMSDLRESGAIEQDADIIMFIYRDEVYNKERSDNKGLAEVIIGKNRNGPIGAVPLGFEGQFTRFKNLINHAPILDEE